MTPLAPLEAEVEAAALRRARLRAARRVRCVRETWSASAGDPWMSATHAEVDRILADPGTARDESDSVADELLPAIAAADEAFAADERWRLLAGRLGLGGPELDLLSLAVVMEADPLLHRVYGYLHDDAAAGRPTPWLAAALFDWPPATVLDHDALVRWRLARPADPAADRASVTTGWVVDVAVAQWLLHGHSLGPGAAARPAPSPPRATCLHPEAFSAVLRFVEAMGTRAEIELVGPDGSGKRTLAAQLAEAMGLPLIVGDGQAVHAAHAVGRDAEGLVHRAVRAARLADGAVYWHAADAVPLELRPALAGADVVLLGVPEPLAERPRPDRPRLTVRLEAPGRSARADLWRALTGSALPDALLDWRMTAAELAEAALAAPAGEAAVVDAARRTLHVAAGELFSPLPCPYTRDDLVVAPSVRAHLDELEARARLRGEVHDEWGFRRVSPIGCGVTAMFAGPSGTGKTMAAQVLARSLGLPLYRVDLAGVVNKYIGETEKRLKQVFDLCERSDVVLFFDEADALFGKRTEVKDAHDRFANIEIDYLLQRMEQFEGVAVLATNRKGDLDRAFLRRVRFVVDFLPPGPDERRRLWDRALPDVAPDGTAIVDDEVDRAWLADHVELTGAGVKAVALAAAFLARHEATPIAMRHLLHAARRELAKQSAEPAGFPWEDAWQH
ncbi:MAG TPA: AAA family ATPase [Acidimicrobiales bacterium]|nr:AAA family ATPase [Acidimicrobiales bacterium]